MSPEHDAVVGAGIVGLALAYTLALRGRRVTVFDSTSEPQGASVRNFGTLWPIGQPVGPRRDLALRSLSIWRDVLESCGSWSGTGGSLHLAYESEEWQVLEEFATQARTEGFSCKLLTAAQTRGRQPRIRAQRLLGSLASDSELQINSRRALREIPSWLHTRYGVRFVTGVRVTACRERIIRSGDRQWEVDRVWIAPGDDLHTLYPEAFAGLGLRRCKLQMMRTDPVPWSLGTILAAGLTLIHYDSFRGCSTLPALQTRLRDQWPEHIANGVHVLVSQHDDGRLVIGDSHEYDDAITPYDRADVDRLILRYLSTFLELDATAIAEHWHGIYVKHPVEPYCVIRPEPGVTAVAALGGHGMTLSFGLAEQVVGEALA